jgi:hypothetical protein
MHLDGARMFLASAYTGHIPAQYAACSTRCTCRCINTSTRRLARSSPGRRHSAVVLPHFRRLRRTVSNRRTERREVPLVVRWPLARIAAVFGGRSLRTGGAGGRRWGAAPRCAACARPGPAAASANADSADAVTNRLMRGTRTQPSPLGGTRDYYRTSDFSAASFEKRSFFQLLESLAKLLLGIHHDRTIPRHWFLQWLAGNQQKTNSVYAPFHFELVAVVK